MISNNTKFVKKWRAFLILCYGAKCFFCESTKKLQFAHVLPTKLSGCGRGSFERVIDVLLNPDAYILLCDKCHVKFDANIERNSRNLSLLRF
jgi:hypothetical protein